MKNVKAELIVVMTDIPIITTTTTTAALAVDIIIGTIVKELIIDLIITGIVVAVAGMDLARSPALKKPMESHQTQVKPVLKANSKHFWIN